MGDVDPTRGAVPYDDDQTPPEHTVTQQPETDLAADPQPLTPDEQALLDDLAAALAVTDPVPTALVEAAKQSLTWRTIDADIAALVGDSAQEPVRVRDGGESSRRLLTFEIGSTALVLEVDVRGRARRLLGQILRPRSAQVQVRHAGGSTDVTADESGRFTVEDVPAGPLSLVCRFLDGVSRPVATSWVAV